MFGPVVQRLECLAGSQEITGSNPVGSTRGVVQMARTLGWGSKGREFKSRRPDLYGKINENSQ